MNNLYKFILILLIISILALLNIGPEPIAFCDNILTLDIVKRALHKLSENEDIIALYGNTEKYIPIILQDPDLLNVLNDFALTQEFKANYLYNKFIHIIQTDLILTFLNEYIKGREFFEAFGITRFPGRRVIYGNLIFNNLINEAFINDFMNTTQCVQILQNINITYDQKCNQIRDLFLEYTNNTMKKFTYTPFAVFPGPINFISNTIIIFAVTTTLNQLSIILDVSYHIYVSFYDVSKEVIKGFIDNYLR